MGDEEIFKIFVLYTLMDLFKNDPDFYKEIMTKISIPSKDELKMMKQAILDTANHEEKKKEEKKTK